MNQSSAPEAIDPPTCSSLAEVEFLRLRTIANELVNHFGEIAPGFTATAWRDTRMHRVTAALKQSESLRLSLRPARDAYSVALLEIGDTLNDAVAAYAHTPVDVNGLQTAMRTLEQRLARTAPLARPQIARPRLVTHEEVEDMVTEALKPLPWWTWRLGGWAWSRLRVDNVITDDQCWRRVWRGLYRRGLA